MKININMLIINNINSQWSSWSRRCSKSAGGAGQFSPTSSSQGAVELVTYYVTLHTHYITYSNKSNALSNFFSGKKVLRSQYLLVSGNKHHIVRFPYCHECHCQWVGEPDYILPDMKIM